MYIPHLFTHSTIDGHLCRLTITNFFLSMLESHVEIFPDLVIGYIDFSLKHLIQKKKKKKGGDIDETRLEISTEGLITLFYVYI